MKGRLQEFALEAGFAKMGICRPDAVPELADRLAAFVGAGMHGQMGWMAERMHWRGDASALWREARSVIMLTENYTPDHDPLAVLAAFGGREQAAICGAVLAARAARIPVILDGFICTAAAAVLHALDAGALDHCLVGHASAGPGHRRLLGILDKKAVLDLGMRLGEGSGAAVALGVLRAALAAHDGMATFAEAGVSGG